MMPWLSKDSFKFLQEIEGFSDSCLEHVDTEITRWVKIGSSSCGQYTAKAASEIIKSSIIPELIKDGKTAEVAYYERLSKIVVDDSCGVLRHDDIDMHIFQKEYVSDYPTYINLTFTTEIHCGFGNYDKVYEQRRCSLHGIGAEDQKSRYLVRQSWIPAEFGKKIPGNVLSQVKPIVMGLTKGLLETAKLSASFSSYLTSTAVMITPSFTTLSPEIQRMLLTKYKEASKCPGTLVHKLVGKTIEEGAKIIFSPDAIMNTSKPLSSITQSVIKANSLPPEGKSGDKPKKSKKKKSDKESPPKADKAKSKKTDSPVDSPLAYFDEFTPKQKALFTKSFGGDFNMFRKLKRKHGLNGKLDLLKLANFFKDG